jgi:hypothetical protein
MCILSGCDYLTRLPGVGLARAKKFIIKARKLVGRTDNLTDHELIEQVKCYTRNLT